MPTYEYRCGACEHELEEFQSITAKPLRKCPACGKNALKRLIGTGAGVVFKGSGFWQTDYARSGEYKKAAESDAAPSSGGEKKSDSGGESKSAGSESKPAESKPAETTAADSKPAKPQTKSSKSGGSKRPSA